MKNAANKLKVDRSMINSRHHRELAAYYNSKVETSLEKMSLNGRNGSLGKN